jgi:hypothetical protein
LLKPPCNEASLDPHGAAAACHADRAAAAAQSGDWHVAAFYFLRAFHAAARGCNPSLTIAMAEHLERLGAFAPAWQGLSAAARSATGKPEWDGRNAAGRTLLIEQRIRHVGAPIRMARLIGLAAPHARRCIVLAEPRLVPLLRRTFPAVEVIAQNTPEAVAAAAEADVVASYETLALHLAADRNAIAASFAPLRADQALTHALFHRYRAPTADASAAAQLCIGLAWTSFNPRKALLRLEEWGDLLHGLDARFVSLQHGDVDDDLDTLRRACGRTILRDTSIDQLADLDAFAAQISALDLVITISNTGAHLAGALGVPTIVIAPQESAYAWQLLLETELWYPALLKVRRYGRAWPQLKADIGSTLEALLAQHGNATRRLGARLTQSRCGR